MSLKIEGTVQYSRTSRSGPSLLPTSVDCFSLTELTRKLQRSTQESLDCSRDSCVNEVFNRLVENIKESLGDNKWSHDPRTCITLIQRVVRYSSSSKPDSQQTFLRYERENIRLSSEIGEK